MSELPSPPRRFEAFVNPAQAVSIAMLIFAILPWPYGYFTLLRLVVCATAILTSASLFERQPSFALGFGVIALLFNPILPVFLPKAFWIVIDLGVAGAFWHVRRARVGERGSIGEPPSHSD